jgi:hypothetical protein
MTKKHDIKKLLARLKNEKIHTWFDLGLFIDRFREEHMLEERCVPERYDLFVSRMRSGGIGFVTFHYMVDGVTVEIGKYAALIEKHFPGIPVHYIGGRFRNKSESIIPGRYQKCKIPELAGFSEWKLYAPFFMQELERGSSSYNSLVVSFWEETLQIVKKLGTYIREQGIEVLYVVNVCSNPGNVSAALALVLLSEFLKIPVINNNHDFYFEGGTSRFDRRLGGVKKGPRDFFFTNAHLGEVFTIIELLFPWESKYWLNVNINSNQTDHLLRYKGHNPARVTEIGTAVDTGAYTKNDKRRNINTFLQFETILARYRKRLISYSAEDVETGSLVSEKNPMPILIGHKTCPVEKFSAENIIFLQPTRIISRKRIELGFSLLKKMIDNAEMQNRLLSTPNLKMTLLISGPIASGHYDYFRKVLTRFRQLIAEVPETFRNRVYLALLLGELDRDSFIRRFERPVSIPDLYNIASLILLPSKTEGRGLPIIEATACGTPIFCRRYDPEAVYSEVIGEHLGEKDRLRVYEFRGKKISKRMVDQLIERVFFPHNFAGETLHNMRIVQQRYSMDALEEDIGRIVKKLHRQLQPVEFERKEARRALGDYRDRLQFSNEDLDFLVRQQHRQYLPGYGRLSYMLMLKSLIDPSYFRVEQQLVRGSIFYFSREILRNDPESGHIPLEKSESFFDAVEQLLHYTDGEVSVRHDHSMSYRHRNKYHYPYQDHTFQELTGIVNLLYMRIVQPVSQVKVDLSPQFFTDWNLALLQLTGAKTLAIDNRDLLIRKLKENLPVAYFPGEFIMYELEFFALQAIRSRLNVPIEEEVTEALLQAHRQQVAPVYIFAQEHKLGKQLNRQEIENYIEKGLSNELKLLYEYGLVRIVSTQQLCVGIHFPQLGEKALRILRMIREQGGFLLTNRRHAALMTDMVNMDRFHIGRIRTPFSANIMGIPPDSGYIQFVPAGLRATLAYPTPVQTALDLHRALQSDEYRMLEKKMGEQALKEALREDAEQREAPVMYALKRLAGKEDAPSAVTIGYLSGRYSDGNPYSGVFARIDPEAHDWRFRAVHSTGKPRTVSEFAAEFEHASGQHAGLAWNGGYILNPELVGKLGLPESYIGAPLGLLITDGICLSPPLFNKAALLVDNKGRVEIKRVSCRDGITLTLDGRSYELTPEQYNPADPGDAIAYYDLMYRGKSIPAAGRTIVRFSGRTVMEILPAQVKKQVRIIPVGLTVSFPEGKLPPGLRVGQEAELVLPGMEHLQHAVEAGPLLLEDGKVSIDMEKEGWKTGYSIATQAARLDYPDMRGPKIAVGMDGAGHLVVLTVNGRIRESVGATHRDMAEILADQGMVRAMGFDPGGSSTLYAGGRNLNISPYNRDYEYNVYALPPQPRAVSNAIIGYIQKGG